MGKVITEFLVKKPYITRHINVYKARIGVDPVDYLLELNKSQFEYLSDIGVSVKQYHRGEDDTDIYAVNVTPAKIPETKYNPEIPVPSEEMFVERSDIDIKFFVYQVEYKDKKICKLYFNNKSITVRYKKGETNGIHED